MVFSTGFGSARYEAPYSIAAPVGMSWQWKAKRLCWNGVAVVVVQVHAMEAGPLLSMRVPGEVLADLPDRSVEVVVLGAAPARPRSPRPCRRNHGR